MIRVPHRTAPLWPALLAGLALALGGRDADRVAATGQRPTDVQVYATGFVNPKGMAFGPDGTLYVAEAGAPGDVVVALPSGYGGNGPIGRNGRVSRVRPGGQREDFITGLPNIGIYGGIEMIGAAAVASLNGQLYEVAGAHMTVSPVLARVGPDGGLTPVADVGAFNKANPPPPSNGDALPTGNPFDLVPLGGALYISDGNYNRILRATPDGALSVVAQWENSPVTVGMAAGPDGNLYVAQFSPEPYVKGSARVDRVTPDGKVTEGVVKDLTNAIDVAFAPDGTMYVLQFVSQFDAARRRYFPAGGMVLRVGAGGSTTPVITNLNFPTAMLFGPDGALYVNNYGNEGNDGRGQVLRVTLGDGPARAPDLPPPTDPRPLGTPAGSRSGTAATAAPSPSPTAAASTGPAATITIVEGSDPQKWGYDPSTVTVRVGDTVVFTNGGQVAHTATQSQGAFDTGLLKGGESKTVALDRPGTLEYTCQPHPWMKGTIVVQGEGGAAAAGPATAPGTKDSPPTIDPLRAAGLVGLIIVAVFAAGYAMRRRPTAPEPPAPGADD